MEFTDYDLVRRCKDSDDAAFEELVKRYRSRVYATAYNFLRNHEHARDISQEAFIRVYKSISSFKAGVSFYTWLYRIVINLCIDHLRKSSRYSAISNANLDNHPTKDALPHELAEKEELRREVGRILEMLPQNYRIVLTLRDIDGMECGEISAIIDRSESTVRWRLHRARKLFKDTWERRAKRDDFRQFSPGT